MCQPPCSSISWPDESSTCHDADVSTALKDFNKLVHEIFLMYVASVHHVAGSERRAFTVRLLKHRPGSPKGTYVKKVLSIDPATWSINTAEIEGGNLAQGFRKWWPTVSLLPKRNQVTVHWTVSYEGGEDAADVIIDQTKDGILLLSKKLEEHILTSGDYPR
ncbi:hypothetical protein R1flu_027411 [Riccia fluitans]|uniref:Uncharacterized protein n=1 Tax=Riccia fluitans TaxID=41844 RepID=A0ABD1XJG3_9MARC